MSLRGEKLNLRGFDERKVLAEGLGHGTRISDHLARGAVGAIGALSPAATAATQASLDAGIAAMPRIREAQLQFNPELFAGIAEQERLAGGDIAQRLEREASERLGTGLTFDESRALREASRGAFTSRGRFRDTGSIFDELQRRTEADTQRRMQNAQFAAGVLGTRQSLFNTPLMHRQRLLLDPRQASGISASQLMNAGIGIAGKGLGAGIGLAEQAETQGLAVEHAMAAANRKKGMLGKIVGGVGAAVGGIFGGPMGAQAGASAGSALGGMFEHSGAEGGGFSLPGMGAGGGGGMFNFGSLFGGKDGVMFSDRKRDGRQGPFQSNGKF
jgi:hypothetical protein